MASDFRFPLFIQPQRRHQTDLLPTRQTLFPFPQILVLRYSFGLPSFTIASNVSPLHNRARTPTSRKFTILQRLICDTLYTQYYFPFATIFFVPPICATYPSPPFPRLQRSKSPPRPRAKRLRTAFKFSREEGPGAARTRKRQKHTRYRHERTKNKKKSLVFQKVYKQRVRPATPP